MQIAKLMVRLVDAGDVDAIADVVSDIGRNELGLDQCGVSWQTTGAGTTASGAVPWWLANPALFDRLFVVMREHHAPTGEDSASDGVHKLVLPIVEPVGLLGAICCGHREAYSAELRRDLMTLALHVSVRVAKLESHAANQLLLGQLTPRQIDVALLAARGRTNAAIAQALVLSENTVKKHLKDIFDILGVANRTELSIRLNGAEDSPPLPRETRELPRLASGER